MVEDPTDSKTVLSPNTYLVSPGSYGSVGSTNEGAVLFVAGERRHDYDELVPQSYQGLGACQGSENESESTHQVPPKSKAKICRVAVLLLGIFAVLFAILSLKGGSLFGSELEAVASRPGIYEGLVQVSSHDEAHDVSLLGRGVASGKTCKKNADCKSGRCQHTGRFGKMCQPPVTERGETCSNDSDYESNKCKKRAMRCK